MRIDLHNISLNEVERDDKARKAGNKAPTAPGVEDKASLSVDTLKRRLARSPGTGCATHQTGQSGGAAAVDPERRLQSGTGQDCPRDFGAQPALADLVHPSLTH